ncbi:uncharacterized protein LOC110454078 [Mizuhopecten yessoensis]|uniref:Antistasin-like domain-containing protein n=1 Tax=Mizuhopecten yessoensis TaxID=6573 RepID=A0A210QFZ7_MIZYE|nr:uncharacterized protein LOC110454078 [Mizuhopecten yessoensis]OWF47670.1 hypothetical protein KP79_PYT22678 [Mizuhopecten yessoensis]
MQLFELLVLFFLGPLFSNAQFNNFMSQMLNGGTGSASATTGSDGCSGASVSCLPAPWCRRTTDDRGCNKCDCGRLGNTQEKSNGTSPVTDHRQQAAPQSFSSFISMLKGAHGPGNSANSGAGFQSMSGMHPGFGGSQMGPMNPMASMFGTNSMFGGGVLAGSMSGAGGVPNIPHGPVDTSGTGSECGTAPYTCMAPPPWCQRLVNSKGCVKCYCGQELTKFLQTLNAITDNPELTSHSSESTVDTSTGTTLSAILRSTQSITMTTARPPLGKPCLATFMCTLSCDTGYQTDDNACPVCACMDDHVILSHDQTTVADLPPVVQSSTPVQKNGIIMCPGIFDCDTVCMTGYQTDANGCPICQCEND